MQRDLETGRLHPFAHRLLGEAKPAVGVLIAQELELVRREVHDQQAARGAEHAGSFPNGARAIVEANGGGYGMGLAYAREMIHPGSISK